MDRDLKELILVGLAIGGFIWAINERTEKQVLAQKLDRKNEDYLNLMSYYLQNQRQIPEEIKKQLISLRREYIGINDAIAMKLYTVIELTHNNKDEIAIEKLALIVENILKEKYEEEGLKKKNKGFPKFAELLKKAKELNWIKSGHYFLSLFLKEKRNEEAHELITNFSENEKVIAFFSGIELIYQLKGVKRVA
jgi:hypothetical protein